MERICSFIYIILIFLLNIQIKNMSAKPAMATQPINIPTFTPMATIKPKIEQSVVRTLFTEEPKPAIPKPVDIITIKKVSPGESKTTAKPVAPPSYLIVDQSNLDSESTRKLLQSFMKSDTSKNDSNNIFMGQKICSPSVFTDPKPPNAAANPTQPLVNSPTGPFYKFSYASQKPEEKMTFGSPKPEEKITFGSPKPDEKITFGTSKPVEKIIFGAPKSEETGEQETKTFTSFLGKPADIKQPLFGKSPQASSTNVPDVLKGGQAFTFGKVEQKSMSPPFEKKSEKSKENIPQPGKELSEKKAENTEIKPTIQPIKLPEQTPKIEVNKQPELKVEKSESSFKPADVAIKTESKPTSIFGVATTQTKTTEAISTTLAESITSSSSNVTSTVSSSIPSLIPKSDVKNETESSSATVSESVSSTTSAFSITGTSNAASKMSISIPASATPSSAFVAVSQQTPAETKPIVHSTPTPATSTPTSPTSQPTLSQPSTTTAPAVISPTGSIFAKTTQSSVFEQSTPQSVFGQTKTTSVFGNTSPAQSLFSAAASNVFGSAATTTSQSIFGSSTGQPAFSTTPTFGANASPGFGKPQGSIFGSPTVTTQATVFGSPVQTTQTSVFGSPTSPVFGATTQSGSIFGTPTTNAQSSVFGTPTTAQTASVFGSPTQTTQGGSLFGAGTTNTSQSGSIFGGAESNLFAAASISTTSASNTSGGNIFGGGSSVFGSNANNVFGSKANFAGANTGSSNIFGGSSTFGQKPATDFWSGGNTSSSPGFGQQTTQAQSIFGNASGGSFSSPSSGQPFGGSPGPFSGGEAKSVFGSPQQQTGSAFGGGSVFGAKPVFGGSPSFGTSTFGGFNKSPTSGFGASASFGGGAAFGTTAFGGSSPGPAFGSSSPGFGSPTQSNATFESLATQNTLTFGNLAQQSGQPAAQPTQSFNASPSFTGWRG